MARVNKSTMIGELLQIDQNVAPILLNIGMHCLGCPSSQMETIEQAAMVHGIDPDNQQLLRSTGLIFTGKAT